MFSLFIMSEYIVLSSVVILLFTVYKIVFFRKSEEKENVKFFGIWFAGLLTLMIGILLTLRKMVETFDEIQKAKDIQIDDVAEGIKGGLIYTAVGIVLFTSSLVLWYVVKWWANRKMMSK